MLEIFEYREFLVNQIDPKNSKDVADENDLEFENLGEAVRGFRGELGDADVKQFYGDLDLNLLA